MTCGMLQSHKYASILNLGAQGDLQKISRSIHVRPFSDNLVGLGSLRCPSEMEKPSTCLQQSIIALCHVVDIVQHWEPGSEQDRSRWLHGVWQFPSADRQLFWWLCKSHLGRQIPKASGPLPTTVVPLVWSEP